MIKIPGGYVLQPRCIDSSWIAHSAPVVREVWFFLLRKANHRDKKYNSFVVKRGQLFISYREIREAISWKIGYRIAMYSENQMKHCMKLLRRQLMIDLTNQPRGNLITICNYDKYQDPKNYESTSESTDESTNDQPMINHPPTAINKNVKNKRIKEHKKSITDSDKSADLSENYYLTKSRKKLSGKRLETFNIFWEAFSFKKSKSTAADSWLKINPMTNKIFEQIIQAAKTEAQNREGLIANGNTPKWAQGWISDRRWEDENMHEETMEEYVKRKGLA